MDTASVSTNAVDDVRQPTGQTVLVTGGGGFIGSHLVSALVDDNDVRVLDDFSTGRRSVLPDGVVRDSDRSPKRRVLVDGRTVGD